jgi:hypothetical protein
MSQLDKIKGLVNSQAETMNEMNQITARDNMVVLSLCLGMCFSAIHWMPSVAKLR